MAIYHCTNSNLIDRIEVRSPRPGIAQATIIAKEGADATELEKLRTQLGAHNISTLMDEKDGRAAIQVRGIKNADPLIDALGKCGITRSSLSKETTEEDKKKFTRGEKVRGKALFLSSIFYDLGNLAFVISGIRRMQHLKLGREVLGEKEYQRKLKSNISEMMIGITFGVGDILMGVYGKDGGDEELNAAAMGLKHHLHKKGIKVPEGDDLNPDTLHQSGAFKASDRWLRKNIGRVKCLTEAIAGIFTIGSGLEKDTHGNINRNKLIGGLVITTGWLATFLLDKPRGYSILDGDKMAITAADKVSDNPRAFIARPAAMFNNVLGGIWGSFVDPKNSERVRFGKELKEAQELFAANPNDDLARKGLAYHTAKQNMYGWNIVSACFFLIANMLFGLSGGKKRPKETEDDKAVMRDLVLLSANVLAKQPEQVRTAVLDETAEYVSKLAHVNLSKEQVARALQEKVTALTHSTWASRLQPPPATPQGPVLG